MSIHGCTRVYIVYMSVLECILVYVHECIIMVVYECTLVYISDGKIDLLCSFKHCCTMDVPFKVL